MARRLLIIWAIVAGAVGGAQALAADAPGTAAQGAAQPAQSGGGAETPGSAAPPTSQPQSSSTTTVPPQVPPARLIKHKGEAKPPARAHPRPLDERCRAPKDQLDAVLQKPGNAHRLFQAKLAYNAGNRLCREGHVDRGMAEFQRGLSYLQENSHP